MGFFDHDYPRHSPERDREFPDEAVGRNGWIGGAVPEVVVLARTSDAVVAVTHMAAFPHGLEVTVSSFVRRLPEPWAEHGWPPLPRPGFEGLTDDHLRFGIEFPGGERVDNIGPESWPPRPGSVEGHGLSWNGGGGGMTGHSWDYWVWPLPTAGEVSFVCEWPVFNIDETRASLDAAVLSEAVKRAQRIWPPPA